ncbi:WD repeat-containing protein 43 isoform X2 [Zophobas morio]|uniref:WD repeat-containing protein 43 isoform X2 n=1 Tax=Zophobas morio TaxID=2755281 RepID=UPI003082CFD2
MVTVLDVLKSEVKKTKCMAVAAKMACQFSEDGKYFAQITSEGKVKIWNTQTNAFEQEFTPDYHLTSSCTCLHFMSLNATSKLGSPRKKKRRESINETNTHIVFGTSSGRLLIYSLLKGDVDCIIDSATSQHINCLSSNKNEYIYSGTDNNVLVWNFYKKNLSSKWPTGNDKVVAILAIPDSDRLLTASKCIKLWSINSQEVIKTYTGHSSLITLLHYIHPVRSTSDAYVISGSKGDRLLSCWNLNEEIDGKNAIASFLMEDIVNHLSVNVAQDGSTHIAATVRSGVVHVYQYTLNGKCSKPIKPKTTVQIVADSQQNGTVSPIHIAAATYRDAETLCICYGTSITQIFEDVKVSAYKKLQCLLRENVLKPNVSKENQISKLRTPVVGNDVHYLSSQSSTISTKRKNDGQQEVPMEKRLENLMVNESDSNEKVPRANNFAKLLIQGLHSKDKSILQTVLLKKDEQLIKNTIKRLPIDVIPPLFEELTKLIQGKTLSRRIGLMWVKNLILINTSLLMTNPNLSTIFGDILRTIEAGLALQAPRNQLMGRLELLVSQINNISKQESQDYEPALVFNDKVSSDSDNDEMEFEEHSSSENEWEEQSSGEEDPDNVKMNETDDQNESDEAMSS